MVIACLYCDRLPTSGSGLRARQPIRMMSFHYGTANCSRRSGLERRLRSAPGRDHGSFRNRWTLKHRFCNITGCPSLVAPPSSFRSSNHRPAVRRLPHPACCAHRLTAHPQRPEFWSYRGAAANCRRKPLKRDRSGRYPTPRCGAAPAGRGIREGGTQEQVRG